MVLSLMARILNGFLWMFVTWVGVGGALFPPVGPGLRTYLTHTLPALALCAWLCRPQRACQSARPRRTDTDTITDTSPP